MRFFAVLLPVWLSFSAFLGAQEAGGSPADALRHPGWNLGGAVFGGLPLLPTPWVPDAPSRYAYNLGASLRLGRVLTSEHGEHWRRGTLEWGFVLIPASMYLIGGDHYYTGGTELATPRWNFTQHRKTSVLFVGADAGMVFGPRKFPPGNTSHANFTAAVEGGGHIFKSKRRSFDVTTRLFHISNAGIGQYNPGVPLSLQLMLGYTWY